MIVVDTNVLVYFYVPGEFSRAAARVYRRDKNWVAPTLWRSEFRNALLFNVRQGRIGEDLAHSIMVEALETMQWVEFEMDSRSVLNVAFQSGLSAYDSEFVALADQLAVPLVTSDKKIIRLFPQIAVAMEEFAAG